MGAKAAPIPLALGTKEKIEVSYADLVGTTTEKKKLRPCGGRQDKTPSEGGGGVRLLKSFFCACTQISTQIFCRLIPKCYICAVNQIYRLLCR